MIHRTSRPALLLAGLVLIGAARAPALNIGDTYDQVIAEKGQPKSQMEAGTRRILKYDDATIKMDNDVVVSFKVVIPPTPPPPTPSPTPPPGAPVQPPDNGPVSKDVSDARNELADAISKVNIIVNQPVQSFPLDSTVQPAVFPIWFHPGAVIPDFPRVEIQRTRDTSLYETLPWISSPLCPGLMFRGTDVEFNSMTKLFYKDRNLPKRKLTDDEMNRVNILYRKIGIYQAFLIRLGHPWTPSGYPP